MSTEQFLIMMFARRTWIPSSFAPETETPSSIGAVDALDGDPVLAADDRDVLDRHVVRLDDDAAADDRAGLADRAPRAA